MEFIKCYWGNTKWGFRVSVRTTFYNRSIAHIQKMIEMLKKDHPDQEVKDDEIAIVIYNTDSFKGIMGVEWSTCKPNKKYHKVDYVGNIF